MIKLLLNRYCFTLLAIILSLAFVCIFTQSQTSALSGADFRAGRIVDDSIYFNGNTMSASQIQTFLDAKVPACDTYGEKMHSSGQTRAQYGISKGYPAPYTCLKDYSQNTPYTAPNAYCSGPVSSGVKSSAQIIFDVAQACNVSPKVLLVLLQKEQSLVTDDWPWSNQYEKATGFACPDTAPCDPAYGGFFYQVYNAARQSQRYIKEPHLFNYEAGQTSYIQYNPTASCGGGDVYIQTQATAVLYNYTPYQPNQRALDNLYGTGDSCSAYGNRNFWRMYIDWFGPTVMSSPWSWSYEGQWTYSDESRTQRFTSIPTVEPGGTIYATVKARNMGTNTWDKSFLRLGTSSPIGRLSPFAHDSWISGSRLVSMSENTVAPGQIASFEFALKAPQSSGTYKEYFNIVAEGLSWLNDLGLYFSINVNTQKSPSSSTQSSLLSGQSVNMNSQLLSPDLQSSLTVQRDGNLVLYSNFSPAWQTGPVGGSGNKLIMQSDGNLVLYDKSMHPLWNTETGGNPGAKLTLQTDGNMVIYSATNVPLWATYTIHIPNHLSYVNTFMKTGRMLPGQQIETADRKYRLILQRDGNLVLYDNITPLWASRTDGKSSSFLAMQSDGNLVLYDKDQHPLWFSGTSGRGLLKLVIQQDGNLVLYNQLNQPQWNTGTYR